MYIYVYIYIGSIDIAVEVNVYIIHVYIYIYTCIYIYIYIYGEVAFWGLPRGGYRQGYGCQALGQKWASCAPPGSPRRSAPPERHGYALLRHMVAPAERHGYALMDYQESLLP